MLKQYTWGVSYIDEACRIHVNGDPVLDPDFDPADPDHTPRELFTLQDANFNVTELYDAAGDLVERYAYDPYGRRQTYTPRRPHRRLRHHPRRPKHPPQRDRSEWH